MDTANPNGQPNLELPITNAEPLPVSERIEKSGDTSSINPETMQGTQTPVVSLPQTTPIPQQDAQMPMPIQTSLPSSLGVTPPLIAEDADLIEKEWVLKAKQIVEKTKYDPYLQNKEMGKFKADYLKKRYNKTINTVED
jgi:hypothetical protein